ncbi:MAG TPA: glycoside hydrolase family 3 C-terminal domain-containing protein [Acidobacteriaceae bacterium]
MSFARTTLAASILALLSPFALHAQIMNANGKQQNVLPTPEQAKAAAAMPFMNSALPIDKRVDDLISRMTLEEKVSQLVDRAAPIPRLNVPFYDYWNEGLHGIARSGYATMFPQAIGNAATWDQPLIKQIGTVVSTEARAKYNDALKHNNHERYYGLTIWSPNINIFRDPRWGRGQETYGEDPFLTGRMAVNFIQGIQGDDPHYYRAIATAKHFAVHSGPESTRHEVNIDPSEHDLWDTYLPQFRMAITEGNADSLMCAYNSVDKAPACANKMLLGDILRKDWGFQGFVTADCDAIDDFSQPRGHHYATDHASGAVAGIQAGTDTDCGAAYLALVDSVHKNLIPESALDVPLRRLFTARMKLGMFDPAAKVPFNAIPFSVVNSAADQALAVRAGRESMVLLKNAGILPLSPTAGKTIAVIGPLAASQIALEGNYNAIPVHPVMPVDGIVSEFGASHVLYAEGAPYITGGAVTVPRSIFHTAANSKVDGLTAEYFATPDFNGKPETTRVDKQLDFDWANANPVPSLSTKTTATDFAVRWAGTVTLPSSGQQAFTVHVGDGSKFALYIDGKEVATSRSGSSAAGGGGIGEPRGDQAQRGVLHFELPFTDTGAHQIRMEMTQTGAGGKGILMEWSPSEQMLRDEAVATASKADIVVAFIGLTSHLEGEEMPVRVKGFAGGDRTDLEVPDVQENLVKALAATGKPMVVVLMNGSALAVNWEQQNAKAILEAWYPGQAGGTAIAETLSGKNNPGGRLPVTFYSSIDQVPPFDSYSMKGRTYRYFTGDPLYRFGDGLSYTTFSYSNLKLSNKTVTAGQPLTVEADVKNTGKRAGEEVAELYLTPPKTDVSPTLALAGFQRLHLAAGQTQHVIFRLDPRTLSQVDAEGVRAVTAGSYRISLGGSQPNGDRAESVKSADFTITGTAPIPR